MPVVDHKPHPAPCSPLDHALTLAERGFCVFPMNPATKSPICAHGTYDASRNPETIRRWFSRSGPVPAIATGEPSGISVLDIDKQHDGLTWWEANRHRLPETWAWRTRSGGLHVAMKHRPELRTVSHGEIGEGIEIRSTGVSAIYWPATGLPVLCSAEPADWPDWLTPPPKPTWTPPPAAPWAGDDRAARRYALGALKRAIEAVAGAAPGTRNATLNRETFTLLRLVDQGGIHAGEIAEAMASAGLAAGLARREIEGTLKSALGARAVR